MSWATGQAWRPWGRAARATASSATALAVIVTLGVAACGPFDGSPWPSSTPLTTLAPPSSAPPVLTPSPTASSTVAIDPNLLTILPAAVDGLLLAENVQGEAAALGDPHLEQVASAFAAGFATEPSGQFVYALVVRLLPDAMDETVFRDWRDSYDEGACSQADGVLGNAETEIDGRTVYIATCAGGLRTYHVWLEASGVLISASAVGERRLGELLVENLRP